MNSTTEKPRFSAARRFAVAALELIYPTTCRICDGKIDDAPLTVFRRENSPQTLFCSECRGKLLASPRTFCRRCGRVARWEKADGDDVLCVACRRAAAKGRVDDALFFDELRPGNFYRGLTRTVVLQLKRERDPALAEAFARLYFASRRRVLEDFAPDFVVPVPMNWRRRSLRGVNSPDFLAATLAKELGVPCLTKTARRVRATPPQASVDWEARRLNVAGAFQIADSAQIRATELAGKRVLIVDDVYTSGATSNELAKVFKEWGVDAVCVATLGRAGLGGRKRRRF